MLVDSKGEWTMGELSGEWRHRSEDPQTPAAVVASLALTNRSVADVCSRKFGTRGVWIEVASFAGKSSTGMCRRLAVQVRNEAFSWVWVWYCWGKKHHVNQPCEPTIFISERMIYEFSYLFQIPDLTYNIHTTNVN